MYKNKLKWLRLPGHRNLKGRAGHTATLVGKDLYVLGGRNGNEFFNDMWLFDTEIEQWKLLQAKLPFSPRAYHTCTLVSDDLWIIGGSDPKTMHSDVHVFNTTSQTWSHPTIIGTKPRGTHAAVLHPLDKHLILIYGGYGGPKSCWMNDLVVLDTVRLEWRELNPEGLRPLGRGYHTFTTFGNFVALFGGKAEGGIINEDQLCVYDVAKNHWSKMMAKGETPSPRSNHAATLMESGLIVVHGGRHGSLRLSDSYVLQVPLVFSDPSKTEFRWHMIERSENSAVTRKGPGKRPLESDSPSGRSAHSLISKGPELYIFGGYGGEGLTFADIFALRRFPKIHEIEVKEQSKASKNNLLIEVQDSIEDLEWENEGWRSTKQPKLDQKRQSNFFLQSVTGDALAQKTNGKSSKKKKITGSDIRSIEPIPNNSKPSEARNASLLDGRPTKIVSEETEFRSLHQSLKYSETAIKEKTSTDTYVQEKMLKLEEEVRRLEKEKTLIDTDAQQNMLNLEQDVRRLEKEKSLTESGFQQNMLKLEQEVQRLQKEKVELQSTIAKMEKEKSEGMQRLHKEKAELETAIGNLERETAQEIQSLQKENSELKSTIGELEKKVAHQSRKGRKMDQENKILRTQIKDLEGSLEEKEKSRQAEVAKLDEMAKKMQALSTSFEESKLLASKAAHERDKYEQCVQTLEKELEKQMEALRQVTSRYEGEKSFYMKEIAERKCTADKLLTELGASKECIRTLEETVKRQAMQFDQDASKITSLQKEKEAFACSNAVLASENKQLTEAKDAAEASVLLLRAELNQKGAEIMHIKEALEQSREHASGLHDSFKKNEELLQKKVEELDSLRNIIRETEEFEQSQIRLLQAHAEKLHCARQSCSGS